VPRLALRVEKRTAAEIQSLDSLDANGSLGFMKRWNCWASSEGCDTSSDREIGITTVGAGMEADFYMR